VIAVDTNILLYSHRKASPWHREAKAVLTNLAEGRKPWAIPWPCLHEFVAISTHPRIFSPPSTLEEAISQINAWRGSPVLAVLSEDDTFHEIWEKTLINAKICGGAAHDAKIASLCLAYGVSVLYSADRDFSRFKGLKVTNPLV